MPKYRVLMLSVAMMLSHHRPAHALTPNLLEKARNATALVVCSTMFNTKDVCPAVCVSRAGMFVTTMSQLGHAENTHRIKLVLLPGQPQQRMVDAKIIRQDPQVNLALLQVEPVASFAPIELGDESAVFNSMEVTTVGFEFQGHSRVGMENLPAGRVLAHHVTSLLKEGGNLKQIRLEGGVGYGQCGAAVLDSNGRMVGLLEEALVGQDRGLIAIPVSAVNRFLEEPVVTLSPTEIPYEKRHEPNQLTLNVTSLLNPEPLYEVELSIHGEGDEPLKLIAPVQNGAADFNFVPLRNTAAKSAIVTAILPQGSVSGELTNPVTIQVGEKSFALNAVGKIDCSQGGSDSIVTLVTGEKIHARVGGLNSVPLDMGELNAKWDLSHAELITIESADAHVRQISFTIKIRAKQTIVSQTSGSINLVSSPKR